MQKQFDRIEDSSSNERGFKGDELAVQLPETGGFRLPELLAERNLQPAAEFRLQFRHLQIKVAELIQFAFR